MLISTKTLFQDEVLVTIGTFDFWNLVWRLVLERMGFFVPRCFSCFNSIFIHCSPSSSDSISIRRFRGRRSAAHSFFPHVICKDCLLRRSSRIPFVNLTFMTCPPSQIAEMKRVAPLIDEHARHQRPIPSIPHQHILRTSLKQLYSG